MNIDLIQSQFVVYIVQNVFFFHVHLGLFDYFCTIHNIQIHVHLNGGVLSFF